MTSTTTARIVLAAATALLALGCEEYTAPPEFKLDFPPEGTFVEGDALKLSFTEPVDAESVRVRVWTDNRNSDGFLPPDLVPLIDICTAASSPCDEEGSSLVFAEDGLSAELLLNPEGIGKPDIALLLEVLPGVRSALTGRSVRDGRMFDFQFKPAVVVEQEVPFEGGEYLFVSVFTDPLPNVISLVSDVRTSPDGRFYLVGAEADNYPGTEQSTQDPTELYIDETDQGFVVFAPGRIRQNDKGERFIETERFDLQLLLLNFDIRINGMRFTGIVLKVPETGRDYIDGTLSYESLALYNATNGRPITPEPYPSATTTFKAYQIPPEQHIPGTPSICGDPCGSVIVQCNPPDEWPPEGVCDDEEDPEPADEGSGE